MARSWEEIQADIEKVKADPAFQKRIAKYKAMKEQEAAKQQAKPKGTQAEHHVTDGKNNSRPIMGKGRAGMGGANVQFGEQIK